MRASDIINQLKVVLPKYSTKFSEYKTVESLTSSGTVATVKITGHGLTTGNFVRIIGAKIPYLVDSLTRVGNQATCITNAVNDITFFNNEDIPQTVDIAGAGESDYNGTKTLMAPKKIKITSLTKSGNTITAVCEEEHGFVVNANFKINVWGAKEQIYNQEDINVASIVSPTSFTYTVIGETNSPATTNNIIYCQAKHNGYTFFYEVLNNPTTPATGTIYQQLIKNGGYNGFHQITVVDVDNFTYNLENSLISPAQGTITADIDRRIDGGLTVESVEESYTKKSPDDYVLYLILGDTFVSKERAELTDITYIYKNGQTYRQNVAYNFDLLVFIPSSNKLTGIEIVDEISQLRRALFKSILGVFLPSPLNEEDKNIYDGVTFIGDGIENYNKAYYEHRFSFQVAGQILTPDIVDEDDSSAFNRITETYKDENDSIGIVQSDLFLR